MNIVAIIQARMGSTRLEGKILKKICDKPVLQLIIERLQKSVLINQIVVATTESKKDSLVVSFCKQNDYLYFRGSEDNVLERFYKCAEQLTADVIVRVTADDPFKDPHIVDKAISILLQNKYDYVSNTIEPTFPEGIDIEVFTFFALSKAYKEAELLSEKEHVTPYIWKNRHLFNTCNFKNPENISHLRWTLDTQQDFIFINEVYKRLYKDGKVFYMQDILALLETEPKLSEINRGIVRNAGYFKSLENEK
jgi:spore coat polysaccharide biosynthesis protein SpsF (cytidylyltransferase family)